MMTESITDWENSTKCFKMKSRESHFVHHNWSRALCSHGYPQTGWVFSVFSKFEEGTYEAEEMKGQKKRVPLSAFMQLVSYFSGTSHFATKNFREELLIQRT